MKSFDLSQLINELQRPFSFIFEFTYENFEKNWLKLINISKFDPELEKRKKQVKKLPKNNKLRIIKNNEKMVILIFKELIFILREQK